MVVGEVAGLVVFYAVLAVLAAGFVLVASGAVAAAWEHTRSVTATGWGRASGQQRVPGVDWARVAALEHDDATYRGQSVDHTSESLAACDQCTPRSRGSDDTPLPRLRNPDHPDTLPQPPTPA